MTNGFHPVKKEVAAGAKKSAKRQDHADSAGKKASVQNAVAKPSQGK